MAEDTSADFYAQTTFPATLSAFTSGLTGPPYSFLNTVGQHSSDSDGFTIQTQTSLTSSSDDFTIQTQTSLTSSSDGGPSVTTTPSTTGGGGPIESVSLTTTTTPETTGGGGSISSISSSTSSSSTPSTTPSGAAQINASAGLLGLVLLVWMGFFSTRY
ncbi:hypothetical protein BJ878DRAFT_484610 [Calycina marina]|uniref:Uncharacterized protein n=1 Tax=Calycina marina TaxID=1763456 RepID=A0A9P7ZCF8_9HELO|nr:hypothetical protein BJ878DRAFT_484610 [Calycina marina]